jgi:hypothetical protein
MTAELTVGPLGSRGKWACMLDFENWCRILSSVAFAPLFYARSRVGQHFGCKWSPDVSCRVIRYWVVVLVLRTEHDDRVYVAQGCMLTIGRVGTRIESLTSRRASRFRRAEGILLTAQQKVDVDEESSS